MFMILRILGLVKGNRGTVAALTAGGERSLKTGWKVILGEVARAVSAGKNALPHGPQVLYGLRLGDLRSKTGRPLNQVRLE